MFIFLSKVLPPFVMPLGLALQLLLLALLLLARGRRRAAGWLIAVALLGLSCLSTSVCADALVGSLEGRYPVMAAAAAPTADAIVILGGGTSGRGPTSPDIELSSSGNRLVYGLRLFRQGKAPRLLLSGGGLYPGESEAEQMRELLGLFGLSGEALILETRSRNTYENATETAKLACDRGLHRLLLVTSASHMPRAAALFRRQGGRCQLEIVPAPTGAIAPTQHVYGLSRFLPSVGALDNTTAALREHIGLLVYGLRGWL